jgi:HK97 family phage prohead protease
MIGSLPVASWDTVQEDARGLRVAGPMARGWLTDPLRDAIRDGRVSGMSIRFVVTRENWSRHGERRIVTGAELYEAGPVALPASPTTSISLRSGRTRSKAQRQALAARLGV